MLVQVRSSSVCLNLAISLTSYGGRLFVSSERHIAVVCSSDFACPSGISYRSIPALVLLVFGQTTTAPDEAVAPEAHKNYLHSSCSLFSSAFRYSAKAMCFGTMQVSWLIVLMENLNNKSGSWDQINLTQTHNVPTPIR